MKKALIFSPYLDILGGGEVYALNFAASLKKKGFQIHLAWEKDNLIETAKKNLNIDLSDSVFDQKAYNLLTHPGNILGKILHLKKYNLIFFVSDGSIPWLFAKTNLLHFQVPFTTIKPTLQTKLKLKNINHVICNSNFTKKVIDSKLNISSEVLYPPINISPKKQSKKNHILSVGRFTQTLHNKRQDFLIDAFKKLYDQGVKGWKLHLVGSTHEGEDLVNQLKDQAKNYPIFFHTNVEAHELENLYNTSKIFWHASGVDIDENKNPEKVEHFGIAAIEALAAGAVPIVVAKGGLTETVKEGITGFLFTTQEELIKKTQELIADYSKLSPKLISNGSKYSQKFSLVNFNKNTSKYLH